MENKLTSADLIMYKAETLALWRENKLKAVKRLWETGKIISGNNFCLNEAKDMAELWAHEAKTEEDKTGAEAITNYTAIKEENERLQAENKRLKEQRDNLIKATEFAATMLSWERITPHKRKYAVKLINDAILPCVE